MTSYCCLGISPVPEDATEKTPTRGGSTDKTPQRSLLSSHSEERTPLRDDTLFDEEKERSDTPTAEQQDTPRVEKTDRAPDTPPRVEKIDSATAHEELNTIEHLKRQEEVKTESSAIAAKEAAFDLPCPTPETPAVSLEPSLSDSVLEDPQAYTRDLAALCLPPPPAEGDFAYRQCLTSDEFEASPPFFPVSNFDLGEWPTFGIFVL
jgi:hypothetical protein